jgi:hypothetical protein
VTQPFGITGWAIDPASGTETAIDWSTSGRTRIPDPARSRRSGATPPWAGRRRTWRRRTGRSSGRRATA